MKSLYILFFILTTSIIASAQLDAGAIALDGKPSDVISSRDTSGNYFFLFQYNKTYQASILDANYKEIKKFTIKKSESDSKKNTLIGTIFDQRGAVAYLINQKTKDFSAMRIDRNTGVMDFMSLGSLPNGVNFLKGIEMDGVFYVLAAPNQKNELHIYRSDYGNPFTLSIYPIDFPTFYSKLALRNEELNQKTDGPIGIEYIRYDIEHNIRSATPFKKLYAFGGKIYIIIDEPATSHIITVNTNDNTSAYKKMNFSLDKELNTTPRQGNSFLYKGDLFRVTLSPQQLNLSVIYLDSAVLLRAYNFYPDKTIELVNGVIVQDNSAGDDKIIQKTNQFFNRLMDGKVTVVANNLNDGRYELQLGAYEEIITYNNNSGGWGNRSGISFGIGYGFGPFGFGMPFYDPFYSPSYNSTTKVSTRVCYFESLLRQSDLEHLDGNVPKSIRQKMTEYIEKNFRSSDPELLQMLPAPPNGLVMGVYAKNLDKYKLVFFKRE